MEMLIIDPATDALLASYAELRERAEGPEETTR
jgi:hypothetical protein